MQNNDSKSKITVVVVALVLVLLLVGIGAVVYALIRPSDKNSEPVAVEKAPVSETVTPDPIVRETLRPMIFFTDEGFSQDTYTFPAGTPIEVENQSSKAMQFSSDDHPAHRAEPMLNMKTLEAGKSGTFTPPGKGTYGFHDHLKDQYEGTLIIQ